MIDVMNDKWTKQNAALYFFFLMILIGVKTINFFFGKKCNPDIVTILKIEGTGRLASHLWWLWFDGRIWTESGCRCWCAQNAEAKWKVSEGRNSFLCSFSSSSSSWFQSPSFSHFCRTAFKIFKTPPFSCQFCRIFVPLLQLFQKNFNHFKQLRLLKCDSIDVKTDFSRIEKNSNGILFKIKVPINYLNHFILEISYSDFNVNAFQFECDSQTWKWISNCSSDFFWKFQNNFQKNCNRTSNLCYWILD